MDYRDYAKVMYANGEHNPGKAAAEYLREALNADDPFQSLQHAVTVAFREVYREMRNDAENAIPLWDSEQHDDDSPAEGEHVAGEKTIGGVTYRPGRTQHDRWLEALGTQVYINGKGLILWAEVTLPDIEATIPVYQRQIEGVQRRIAKLESARRVITRYGVTRLGDAPWEVLGFTRDPD